MTFEEWFEAEGYPKHGFFVETNYEIDKEMARRGWIAGQEALLVSLERDSHKELRKRIRAIFDNLKGRR